MLIEVHTLLWGEEQTRETELFLEHYCSFADRVVIWEYGKGSPFEHYCPELPAQVAKYPNAELRAFVCTPNGPDDYCVFKSACWRDSEADWVIVVDGDEYVFHDEIRGYLAYSTWPLIRCWGYEVVGDPQLSVRDGASEWRGQLSHWYCKPAVFRPRENRFLSITRGGHDVLASTRAQPTELVLMHGRYLRGVDGRKARVDAMYHRSPSRPQREAIGLRLSEPLHKFQTEFATITTPNTTMAAILFAKQRLMRGQIGAEELITYLNGEYPPEDGSRWDWSRIGSIIGGADFHIASDPPYINAPNWLDPWVKVGIVLGIHGLAPEDTGLLEQAACLQEWELYRSLELRGYTAEHFPFMACIPPIPDKYREKVDHAAMARFCRAGLSPDVFRLNDQVRTKA